MIFENMSDQQLVNAIMEVEKQRARMDFTRPLFDRLKEIIEREENVIITERSK